MKNLNKKLYLFLTLIFITIQGLWAQNPTPFNINNELQMIIDMRCDRYLTNPVNKNCKKGVLNLVHLLDIKYINEGQLPWSGGVKPVAFIAFHDELIKTLSTKATLSYLKSLRALFDNYLNDQSPLSENIFSFTQKFTNSYDDTLKYMALLFQDTSTAKAHLHYLKEFVKNKTAVQVQNMALLEEIIDIIIHIFLNNRAANIASFYPDFDLNFNQYTSLYHFYVPAYLASVISKDPFLNLKNEKESGFLAPLFFVITYEFVTYAEKMDMTYIFNDPETIKGNSYKVRDIFTAYEASYYFAFNKKPKVSLNTLIKLFETSTNSAIQKLIKY